MQQNDNASDLQLIGLIKEGDNNALGELFKRHRTALIFTARTILSSKEEAEDSVSDLFLSLQSRRNELDITTNVKAYLHQAIRYMCLKKCISIVREETFLAEYQTLQTSHEPAIDRIESAEKQQLVHQAVDSLPDQMKKAVVRWYLEEKERKDVATELDIELSTLAKYLLAARKRLADSAQLKGLYP